MPNPSDTKRVTPKRVPNGGAVQLQAEIMLAEYLRTTMPEVTTWQYTLEPPVTTFQHESQVSQSQVSPSKASTIVIASKGS